MRSHVHGILLLDKPCDITSNHALQRVKRLFQAKKAGHTGSLDPIATGMLPICFGEATKFSQFLLDSSKSYRVIAKLGEQTATGDIEGEIIATKNIPDLSGAKLREALQTFLGKQQQVPPMFSAIKHKGRPLYELARQGIDINRKPRPIEIYDIALEALSHDHFVFYVHCSKGTYVRTLVEDICSALNTVGHVTSLRRLMVKPYDQAVMYTLPALEAILEHGGQRSLSQCLLPVESALQAYPIMKLTAAAAFYLRMGQAVRVKQVLTSPLVRLVGEDESFLGVGEVMSDGRVKPHRLVANA